MSAQYDAPVGGALPREKVFAALRAPLHAPTQVGKAGKRSHAPAKANGGGRRRTLNEERERERWRSASLWQRARARVAAHSGKGKGGAQGGAREQGGESEAERREARRRKGVGKGRARAASSLHRRRRPLSLPPGAAVEKVGGRESDRGSGEAAAAQCPSEGATGENTGQSRAADKKGGKKKEENNRSFSFCRLLLCPSRCVWRSA